MTRGSVDDVGFEVKVQLALSTRDEGETTYLTLHFSVLGFVTVILGAGGSKLDNVVPRFQVAGEFAEIITRAWQINSKWPLIKVPEIVTSPAINQVGQVGNWGVDGMGG